jgi:hypothetical protein
MSPGHLKMPELPAARSVIIDAIKATVGAGSSMRIYVTPDKYLKAFHRKSMTTNI